MRTFEESLELETTKHKQKFIQKIKSLALKTIITGILIFVTFFLVVLVTKLFSYILSSNLPFSFNIYDFTFALVGFGVGFLINFLINLRKITAN